MAPHQLPVARLEAPSVRALARDRVDQLLSRALDVAVTVIVGPAGAGKTTAAVHLAHGAPGPVLWYRASAVDGDPAQLSAHLAAAVAHAHGHEPTWATLADAWHWLADWAPPAGVLVVIDEFDAVIGEAAERELAAVLADAAPNVHTVVMSRRRPSLGLTRLRLAGLGVEIGPDDLRFRSWEVDRLFRELYGRPLAPDQVAELERRSGGWIAALQLFDLATAHLTPDAREATISRVGRRAGPDWEYLADNVLAGLTDEHREFLVATAPLDRLEPGLCDELLGTRCSGRHLDDLERMQLVAAAADDPGSYRCHEVLRAHLEALLVERDGEAAVRKVCAIAGRLLEARGRYAEALRALLRADDRGGAERVLRSRGGDLAGRPGAWVDRLPPRLVESDPWLLLARARQYRTDGRLDDAVAAYERLEAGALSTSLIGIARTERFVTAALADRRQRAPTGWITLMRSAAAGEVRAVAEHASDTAIDQLMLGLARLVAGDPHHAGRALRAAAARPDAATPVLLAARLGLAITSHMSGDPDPDEAVTLERMATAHDLPFFARLCGAVSRTMSGSRAAIGETVAACDHVGDQYGAALCEWVGAVLHIAGPDLDVGEPSPRATERCKRLGMDGLTWWTELARLGDGDDTRERARVIELEARRRGAAPMASLAGLLVKPTEERAADHTPARLSDEYGLRTDSWLDDLRLDGCTSAVQGDAPPAPLTVRCFGGLTIVDGDRPVDLTGLRPRALSVLALLAIHRGSLLHREVICGELWPDDDVETATRKLHVAVSSIRKVVRTSTGEQLVVRRGESYLLASERGVVVDVGQFWELADAVDLASPTDPDAGTGAERAFRLRGELLPEFGPVDWLVEPRRRIDAASVRLAACRAGSLVAGGDPSAAAGWCRRGLEIDSWSDPLWRLLLDALERADDQAALTRARRDYETVLTALDVG